MPVGFREKARVNMGRIECVVKGVGTDCIGCKVMSLLRTQPAQVSADIVAELCVQLTTHRGWLTPIMIATSTLWRARPSTLEVDLGKGV
jgi:hypothetical protein